MILTFSKILVCSFNATGHLRKEKLRHSKPVSPGKFHSTGQFKGFPLQLGVGPARMRGLNYLGGCFADSQRHVLRATFPETRRLRAVSYHTSQDVQQFRLGRDYDLCTFPAEAAGRRLRIAFRKTSLAATFDPGFCSRTLRGNRCSSTGRLR
jgi:hypothetical protein